MINNRLNVGILICSSEIPAWQLKMLNTLNDSNYSKIALILQNKNEGKEKFRNGKKNKIGRKIVYKLYTKYDRLLFKVKPDPFKLHNIFSYFPISVIQIPNKNNSKKNYLKTIDEVKKINLDIIIKLETSELKIELFEIPKYGVWSYHIADSSVNRGTPPGFWEVMNKCSVTGSELQILTLNPGYEKVLYRSYSMTDPNSVARNINSILWKSAMFIPRKLQELHSIGEDKFFERLKVNNIHPDFYSNRNFQIPNNFEMLNLLTKHLSRYLKDKIIETLFVEQWHLQYAMSDDNFPPNLLHSYKNIIPPKDRFWADPNFIKRNDKYYIFFEELIYSNKKAHISVIELDKKGNISSPEIVLKKDYHLSFPFVFEVNGDLYMIPETSENKTIELYKCVVFPNKWELENVLLKNIVGVDANILYHHEKWWLFVNLKEIDGISLYDELFLFYSDDFSGTKWTPHPKNPIISDARTARPAGRIFKYGDNLYRPSQNCAKRYGYGININHIIKLDEYEYKEERVNFIEPKWGKRYIGTHTFNHSDDFTIVDVLTRRRKIF